MPKAHRIAWLNGRFLPMEEACISPLDRGFLYGDGVYEVIAVYNGKPFETAAHLQRLQRSLEAIGLDDGMTDDEWQDVLNTLIERNDLQDAALYLQVTRGVTEGRDHVFPTDPAPTVFAMATARSSNPAATGSAITLEDIRWHHNHIKATSLLGNVLLRQAAAETGADEAILLRDGCAIEASSSNLFIVKDGVLVTPELQPHVLAGITRQVILSVASEHGVPVEERRITETELRAADEIWVASSMREILSITELDGMPVGNGQPGAIITTLKPAFAARTSS